MNNALVGILRVLLTIDSAQFESGMKKSTDSMRRMSRDLGQIGRQASDIGMRFTVGLTAPIVAFAVASTKAAITFESSFAGVRKTVDATEAEFAQMSSALRQLSKEIPVNVNELNRLAEAAGALGIPKEEIVDFARVMAMLGVTTNLTSDQAAESIAKIQNIFGAAGKQTENFASTLVALGNDGAATETQIVDMATRIAGAGHTFGMTQGQVLGWANALASVGLEAEAGGSAISRTLRDMATAVSEGGKEFEAFKKIAGEDFAKTFKEDASGALLAFIEGLAKVKAEGGDLIATLKELGIVESRQIDTLLRAAGAGDVARKSLELQNKAWGENSALTEEAQERFKTTASQLTTLKNQLMDVGITIGMALKPTLDALIKGFAFLIPILEGAANLFAALPGPIQVGIIAFAGLLAAVGPLLYIFGQLALSASALAAAFAKKGIATRLLTMLFNALTAAQVANTAATNAGTVATVASTGAMARMGVVMRALMAAGVSAMAGLRLAISSLLGPLGLVLAAVVAIQQAVTSDTFRNWMMTSSGGMADLVRRSIGVQEAVLPKAPPRPAMLSPAAAEFGENEQAAKKMAEALKLTDSTVTAYTRSAKAAKAETKALADAFSQLDAAQLMTPGQLASAERANTMSAQAELLASFGLNPDGTDLIHNIDDPGAPLREFRDSFDSVESSILDAVEAQEDLDAEIQSAIDGAQNFNAEIEKPVSTVRKIVDTAALAVGVFGQMASAAKNIAAQFDAAMTGTTRAQTTLQGATTGAEAFSFLGPYGALFGFGAGAVIGAAQDPRTAVLMALNDFRVGIIKTFDQIATEAQRMEAGTDKWAQMNVLIRDTYEDIGMSAADAERDVDNLFDSDNLTEYERNLKRINEAFERQSQLTDARRQRQEMLNEAVERYGFTFEEAGKMFQRGNLATQAETLIQDYQLLTESGADVATVAQRMAAATNAFVQQAVETGTEIPEAMRPLLAAMVDAGLLVDASGKRVDDFASAGIKFGKELEVMFENVLTKLDQLIEALMRPFTDFPEGRFGPPTGTRPVPRTEPLSDGPIGRGPASRHMGGMVTAHKGAFLGPNEVMVKALIGESVLTPQATAMFGGKPGIDAINSGRMFGGMGAAMAGMGTRFSTVAAEGLRAGSLRDAGGSSGLRTQDGSLTIGHLSMVVNGSNLSRSELVDAMTKEFPRALHNNVNGARTKVSKTVGDTLHGRGRL